MAKDNEQDRWYAVPDYMTKLFEEMTKLFEDVAKAQHKDITEDQLKEMAEDQRQDMIPPGHRFGLYFKGWHYGNTAKDKWTLDKEQKSAALKEVTQLGSTAAELSTALFDRQSSLKGQMPEQVFHLYAKNTSPFMTGMGNEHPVENGFAFLSPYGVPYLAGSSIKGMLLRAAKYLAFNQRDNWSDAAINVLFGSADVDEAGNPIKGKQGALRFWDCFPQVAKHKLAVEIITPHNGDYLQGDSTPHTSGQPVPIPFLAIPPESAFDFFIQADLARLDQELKSHWQTMLKAAFTTLFEFVGMGAKTAVGYGQMQERPTTTLKAVRAKWDEGRRSIVITDDANKELVHFPGTSSQSQWQKLPAEVLERYRAATKKKKYIKVNVVYEPLGNESTLLSIHPLP